MGFLLGAYPERWSKMWGQKPHSLSLVFSDEKLVPMQLLLNFEKSTGTNFQVKVIPSYFLFQTEVQKTDLIFVPFNWYENSLPLMFDSPTMTDFTDFLFTDFISLRIASAQFLPVFWRVEKNKLQNSSDLMLWGFSVGKKKSESNPAAFELIQFLLKDPARMESWIQQTKLASTLKASDQYKNISENLKASQLREYPLSELSIKHQLD